MAKSIVELKNINKSFPMEMGGVQQVLFNINMDIKQGEFIAIMGPSGSGKSTCMNIIGALDSPTSGIYKLYDSDITNYTADELATARNEYIGFVFQNFNLLTKRNVLDNVCLPLMYRGFTESARENMAKKYIKMVGLEKFWSYLPTQLSGGMRQRCAIARALSGEPKLILADEPTGALDSKTGAEILQMFQKLNHELKTTVIMITHDFNIAKYATGVIHIRDGRITYDGSIPKKEQDLL